MAWTLSISSMAVVAAGIHANSTIAADAVTLAAWSDQVEGSIEQDTNTSWVAGYSSLSTSMKNALSDIASSRIAKRIIAYDPTGYLTREADMLMNMNDDIEIKGLKVLEGKADKLKTP